MDVSLLGSKRDLLPKFSLSLALVYDWISGPPMTNQERIHRAIQAAEATRRLEQHCI